MKKLTCFGVLVLVMGMLAGCGQIEVGIEMPVMPTSPGTQEVVVVQVSPSAAPVTPTLKPTAAATAVIIIPPTHTIISSPTVTLTPTDTQPPPQPTTTKTAVPSPTTTPTNVPLPEIHNFSVEPQEVAPESVLTMNWSTSGERVELCVYQSGNSGYYECWPVAVSDTLAWKLPQRLSTGFWVELIVYQGEQQIADGKFVQVSCAKPEDWWFFSPSPTGCPMGDAVETAAAFQFFEHGWMLWLESEDVIYTFFDDGTYAQFYGHQLLGDINSGDGGIDAPDGRIAPIRGFGLVWRGEVNGSENGWIRDKIGWGLYPESGFQAHYQKERRLDTVGMYVTDLNGRIIFMDIPKSNWFVYSDSS